MRTLCKQTMIQAYNWTSFSPEKRGESDFNYYTKMLADDLAELHQAQGSTGNYEEKFIEKVMTIFHRQSRCASPMITGPANFNNRRNGKAWNSRDNALQEFSQWRERYFKLVHRERTLSPEEEIDKTVEEIERLEVRRDMYKLANKVKGDREAVNAWLEENYQYTDREKSYLDYGNNKFPQFCIASITTKIRERNKKLDVMKSRIETKSEWQKIEFVGGYVDIENDRVVIKHDQKPSAEILQIIKANGFKYSPRTQSWVRKHTENAVHAVKKILPKLSEVA